MIQIMLWVVPFKQAAEAGAVAERSVAEREAAIQDCETQRSRLMQMMENYKTENDRNLNNKVKEVQALKMELDNIKLKQTGKVLL